MKKIQYNELELKDLLLREYRENNKSMPQIQKEINVPRHILSKIIKKYNILYKCKDRTWILQEILKRKSYKDIAKENNLPESSLIIAINNFDLREIYDNNKPRNKTVKNEIIIHNSYAEIILYNNLNEGIKKAIIDIEDIETIKQYKWMFHRVGSDINDGYCSTRKKLKSIYLQDIILKHNGHLLVDHINGNKLDNRKENLRLATNSQNRMNKKLQSNNTSGVSGISFNKRNNKWRVRIKINSKEIYIGEYFSFDDAVLNRLKAEAIYYKEFSYNYNKVTNSIELEYINPTNSKIKIIRIPFEPHYIKSKNI